MPFEVWYFVAIIAVCLVWFVIVRRPMYEALAISFIVCLAISGTWSETHCVYSDGARSVHTVHYPVLPDFCPDTQGNRSYIQDSKYYYSSCRTSVRRRGDRLPCSVNLYGVCSRYRTGQRDRDRQHHHTADEESWLQAGVCSLCRCSMRRTGSHCPAQFQHSSVFCLPGKCSRRRCIYILTALDGVLRHCSLVHTAPFHTDYDYV